MATTDFSISSGASSSAQWQLRTAEKEAQQAENTAQRLRSQAEAAQRKADDEQDKADHLHKNAGQAQDRADAAHSQLSSARTDAAPRVGLESNTRSNWPQPGAATRPTLNALGQSIGTRVHVTA